MRCLAYYANQCLNPSEISMTTHTLPATPTSLPRRIGRRVRALVEALAAWRRKRAIEDRTIRASRKLAELSCHVLRDIGMNDAGFPRACAGEPRRLSAIDLEIRG